VIIAIHLTTQHDGIVSNQGSGEDPKDVEKPADDETEVLIPGHRLNVTVKRNDDAAVHGPKPFLAIMDRRRGNRVAVGFDTKVGGNRAWRRGD
jgi:hypothetical protein